VAVMMIRSWSDIVTATDAYHGAETFAPDPALGQRIWAERIDVR
jgi:hypothetical protein